MERDLYEHQMKPAKHKDQNSATTTELPVVSSSGSRVSYSEMNPAKDKDQDAATIELPVASSSGIRVSCSKVNPAKDKDQDAATTELPVVSSSGSRVSYSEVLATSNKSHVVLDVSSCDSGDSSSDDDVDSDYLPSSASDGGKSIELELPGLRSLNIQRKAGYMETNSSASAMSNLPDSSLVLPVSASCRASSSSEVPSVAQPLQSSEVSQCDAKSSKIRVATTNNEGSVRKWDKKHFCCYCSKPQAKLPRHFEQCHETEPDILQLKSKSSAARRNQLTKLRNLGNHLHNCEVLRDEKGVLIVAYRPSEVDVNPHSYGPCPHCYGYYIRRDLWRHRCPFRPDEGQSSSGTNTCKHSGRIAAQSDLLKPSSAAASYELKNVLCSMKKDAVSLVVKADDLILQLGKREYMKHGHNPEQYNYLRTKLRELGRLLIHLRKNTGNHSGSLEDFICPTKMADIVSAVHDVAGFDVERHTFSVPSLSLKLGHSLKKVAMIMKADALEKGDKEKEERAEKFLQLCEYTWEVQVATHALRTLNDAKRNAPESLPTNSDIVRVSQYLRTVGEQQLRLLQGDGDNCDRDAWNLLNETTLCQVIMFNRRRQGEVSKMKVADYKKKHKAIQTDMCILSMVEKGLCKMMEVIEIVGKRGRTVPVIVTPAMTEQLNVLLETRESVGVSRDNTYLFARSSYASLGYIRGSDCLRKHAALGGAASPQCIRSTKLRKHIATASQMLSLSEQQLDLLASYMGHDLRVHREYYQIPDTVLRVAKLSKLFISLEKGTLPTQQGKSLDDLTVGDDSSDDDDTDQSSDDGPMASHPNEESNEENLSTKQQKGSVRHHQIPAAAKGKKRPWSEAETTAVKRLQPILHFRLPGKADIEKIQQECPELGGRTWRNIKDYLRNNRRKLTQVQ